MPIKFADIEWPTTPRYWLADARVPVCLLAQGTTLSMPADAEGVVVADLLIDDGKVVRIERSEHDRYDGVRVDLGGRQV